MTVKNDVMRKTADDPWPLKSGWGSHRALVSVDSPSVAVRAVIKWRRRDTEPEKIGLRIKYIETGEEISDIIVEISARDEGIVFFRAPYKGLYGIYYLPFVICGELWYFPDVGYMKTEEMHCGQAWKNSVIKSMAEPGMIRKAELIAIESRTDFDRFDPMEVPANEQEADGFLSEHISEAFLLFPEERIYPIRMQKEIPLRWIQRGTGSIYKGTARPGEYFVFQIGFLALEDLKDIQVGFERPDGDTSRLTCFNTEGNDWLGRGFVKQIDVQKGFIQPLWVGVDLSDDANGLYGFDISITASGCTKRVHTALEIKGDTMPDHGDGDLWRLSRLRWLNSRTGIDDEAVRGYLPVGIKGNAVSCLGRIVDFDVSGLPLSISSFFSREDGSIGDKPSEILFSPVRMDIVKDKKDIKWVADPLNINKISTGRADIYSHAAADHLDCVCTSVMEFDGHIDTVVTLTAGKDISVDDIRLIVPIKKDAARYMMGFGREGGSCPENWLYKWDIDKANNAVWIGSPNAGIQIKLKHDGDVWEPYGYRKQGLPSSWSNGGLGGCHISEQADCVLFDAFSGPRELKCGEKITFHFSLLITPLRPIDTDAHWDQRYYHTDTWEFDIPSLDKASKAGASVVNLHQGGSLNQFINYPFLRSAELKEQTDLAHKKGLKYKIYYTVRELSNHAAELWTIRSLGDEVLRQGPGFKLADHFNKEVHGNGTGGPWLCEHLTEGFVPAWQQILSDGDYDSAIAMTGLSRWHNHYLEGLGWLMRKEGMDGIYLDGVGYDRQIMKRVRKTIDRAKDGCLIDFHSGNNFDPMYGSSSPMNQYLELMPYIDSLWIGEGYDYEKTSPEYWLTEISGIPFGPMGDMLQGGGNPWRGMVFGMTCRLGWQQGGDPVPLWDFWRSYGMKGVTMRGWWNSSCPVATGNDKIKATAYIKPGNVLAAIASWADGPADIRLDIDKHALGLPDGDVSIEAPYIEGFQHSLRLYNGDSLRVEPGRGWLLIIKKPEN
jgi:hypothetical protein